MGVIVTTSFPTAYIDFTYTGFVPDPPPEGDGGGARRLYMDPTTFELSVITPDGTIVDLESTGVTTLQVGTDALDGDLVLAAGSNMTISHVGSTITFSATGTSTTTESISRTFCLMGA